MANIKKLGVAIACTSALALALVGCSSKSDDDCRTQTVMFFSNGQYHYGSPTGSLVPDSKVPSSARKVPGYKPYTPPKAATPPKAPAQPKPAVPMQKAPAPKAPVPKGR